MGPLGGPFGGVVPPGRGSHGPMPGPLGPLGGMHVGPDHPFFSDRMRHPDLGPGGFGRGRQPGGARWDPISESPVVRSGVREGTAFLTAFGWAACILEGLLR